MQYRAQLYGRPDRPVNDVAVSADRHTAGLTGGLGGAAGLRDVPGTAR